MEIPEKAVGVAEGAREEVFMRKSGDTIGR